MRKLLEHAGITLLMLFLGTGLCLLMVGGYLTAVHAVTTALTPCPPCP